MITVIILTIIAVVLGAYAAYDMWIAYDSSTTSKILDITLGAFIGGMCGVFIGIIIAGAIPIESKTVVDTYYIESLQDNSNISGNFYLGSGYIKEEMNYVFYYKSSEGYRLMQLSSKKALIKYTNGTPKVECYRQEKTDAFINKFNVEIDGCNSFKKYIIYVPKGTIMQNYNLDAQ